ncbi:MAG: glycosyltransferase family 4 protein [Coleofasciculus sp. G3-WIS-01]|uniref:glycosyltransferase family 4 protein n=1 Tax=Coleofasciculus sp. G3-WIS-01 TaxID=3069528 RepID=UPI0032F3415A
MRIVLIAETFSKNMGYLGNILPKYLARLGVDVHMIAMDLPHYYQMKDFKETYGNFTDSTVLPPGTVERYDGYTLHIQAHKRLMGYMRIVGLWDKLQTIRPDIVQSLPAIGWIPLDASLFKPVLKYKLFTGSHTAASCFPLAKRQTPFWHRERLKCFVTRTILGRLVSLATEKCYAPTKDCAEIAWRFFGVEQHKVEVMHLGVDTDFFFPAISDATVQERKALRQRLGFGENDVVCIYTGKFTEEKNALILAKAISQLRSMGEAFCGLFIGNGLQKKLIQTHSSCRILDFMPFSELAPYYRAADIGVWPTNESTSMLDAAACGIPIIVSDGIVYREHVEGNGLVYKMNDLDDLVRVLLHLHNFKERKQLGSFGSEKMLKEFSWYSVAKRRLKEYEAALSSQRR